MAFNTTITPTAAKAAVDAVVDLFDGAGTPKVAIYNGSQPASPAATLGGATKLAEISLDTGAAFGAANTTATASYAVATMASAPLSDTSATGHATLVAQFFRATDQAGNGLIDGSVGTTASNDMQIDNTSIANGQTVVITSWKVRLQYK